MFFLCTFRSDDLFSVSATIQANYIVLFISSHVHHVIEQLYHGMDLVDGPFEKHGELAPVRLSHRPPPSAFDGYSGRKPFKLRPGLLYVRIAQYPRFVAGCNLRTAVSHRVAPQGCVAPRLCVASGQTWLVPAPTLRSDLPLPPTPNKWHKGFLACVTSQNGIAASERL